MSLKEEDYISINISKNTTINEVLQEIAVSFKINSLRDFGLFLDYQDIPRLLDRDEKLKQVLDDIGYEFRVKQTQQ